jgi:hypothetical protein
MDFYLLILTFILVGGLSTDLSNLLSLVRRNYWPISNTLSALKHEAV